MCELRENRKNHDSFDFNTFFQRHLFTFLKSIIFFFLEIIIVSFCCEECGYKNNEVQSGGKISDLGSKVSLVVTKLEDLSRDVIKSEFASIHIPELDFEVPPTKKGYLNTIEGFLNNFIDELAAHQDERKVFN